MSTAMTQQKARIIKADTTLQKKAGTGEVDQTLVVKAETVIEKNAEDFGPMATDFLNMLASGIQSAREGVVEEKHRIAGMTQPVMQLKANARMFKYDLVTSLANIMLSFLEHIKELDKDAIDIVDAHHKTLTAIIHRKMTGDGGASGKLLQTELEQACQRYMKSRQAKG